MTAVAEKVQWVGAVDWAARQFHGHELSVHRGTTYNAYLVLDEKVTLVDSVGASFAAEWLDKIRQHVRLEDIAYVVANHSELDHSGALPELMRLAPQAELIVSRKGADSIPGHFHQQWNLRTVQTGERLPLGSEELLFIEAPMLHWPDSMFTYLSKARVLMPNDAFGQHYATAYRFNDQVDEGELYHEAMKYYANILAPFSPLVLKKIEEFAALELPVEVIAPSHGVLWRKDPLQIVTTYQEWARQEGEPRAVIVYDSMWEATRLMAEALGRGLAEAGIEYKIYHAALDDRNDMLTDIFRSRGLAVGSPTLNNGILPSLWPLLQDMKGLKFRNKKVCAFGSHGWSGEGVKIIEEHLRSCRLDVCAPGVACKWQPEKEALDACNALGGTLAAAIKKA